MEFVLHADQTQFDGYIEEDETGDMDVFIACVHFTVDKDKTFANLADLNHRKTREKDGTLLMIQSAIAFIFSYFPKMQDIFLYDEAIKKGTRVLITPKKLLLGKQGWYQEHLGAQPGKKTRQVIRYIEKHRTALEQEYEKMSKQSWGTLEDIEAVTSNILPKYFSLLASEWIISRTAVDMYPTRMSYEVLNQAGGYSFKTRVNKKLNQYSKRIFELQTLKHNRRHALNSLTGYNVPANHGS